MQILKFIITLSICYCQNLQQKTKCNVTLEYWNCFYRFLPRKIHVLKSGQLCSIKINNKFVWPNRKSRLILLLHSATTELFQPFNDWSIISSQRVTTLFINFLFNISSASWNINSNNLSKTDFPFPEEIHMWFWYMKSVI